MVLLSLADLLALRYADWDYQAASGSLMGAGYGIATTVIGLGMLAAGAGVVRTRTWSGWRRWTPPAIGIAVFVIVTPGTFSGFVLGRVSIAVWMLLFAALGWSLLAESRRDRQPAPRPVIRPSAASAHR